MFKKQNKSYVKATEILEDSTEPIVTSEMETLNINGSDYELEKLPQSAIDVVNSLKFLAQEIARIDAELAVYQTARNAYTSQLKEEIDKMESNLVD